MCHHILEEKPLNVFNNNGCPISLTVIMVGFFLNDVFTIPYSNLSYFDSSKFDLHYLSSSGRSMLLTECFVNIMKRYSKTALLSL